MAKFQSKHQFLSVWVGDKNIKFFQGYAHTEDKDIIEALEKDPMVERIDEPKQEKPKKETKPKAKSTKKKTTTKAKKTEEPEEK